MPLRAMYFLGLCLVLLFAAPQAVFAQDPGKGPGNVHTAPSKPQKNRDALHRIIVTRPNKYLIGNRCVELYTRKMGFQYTVSHGEMATARWYHNTLTKIALIFKNGPFWQRRVRKRIERCRESSGDFGG